MIECTKRQNENYKGKEQTRCINTDADLFQQVVVKNDCSNCPFAKKKAVKAKPCGPAYNPQLEIKPMWTTQKPAPGIEPQAPGLGTKVKNYAGAIKRWVVNGRPTRTKEEVKEIFESFCSQCDRYDKDAHACKTCGCIVSDANASPLKNKLAMATEHCPLGLF